MDEEIWQYYRREAKTLAEKRDQSVRSSRQAYKRGDGLKAKEYSNAGKHYKKLCEDANRSAANAIFIQNNENRPLTEIDLHGLFVNEAIEKLSECVIEAISIDVRQLDVIVGRGRHSEDGPKLKPSVEQFAKENSISCSFNHPGRIRLHIGRSDKAVEYDDFSSATTQRTDRDSIQIDVPSTSRPSVNLENPQPSEFSYLVFFCIVAFLFLGYLKLLGY